MGNMKEEKAVKKKEREFETIDGKRLKVAHRKSALYLGLAEESGQERNVFSFDKETFVELVQYIDASAHESWKELTIKNADSFGNDYDEYYSREFDNKGYLGIGKQLISCIRPTFDSLELYKFNKAKMGTFLYDARKIVEEKILVKQ